MVSQCEDGLRQRGRCIQAWAYCELQAWHCPSQDFSSASNHARHHICCSSPHNLPVCVIAAWSFIRPRRFQAAHAPIRAHACACSQHTCTCMCSRPHLLWKQVELHCSGSQAVGQGNNDCTWMELSPDCQVLAYTSSPYDQETGTWIIFHDLAKGTMTRTRLSVEQDHVLLTGCWQVGGQASLFKSCKCARWKGVME